MSNRGPLAQPASRRNTKAKYKDFMAEDITLKTIMQQCNVPFVTQPSNYKMEHLLGGLHLVPSRRLGPVQRLIGTFERQVTALSRLELRYPH